MIFDIDLKSPRPNNHHQRANARCRVHLSPCFHQLLECEGGNQGESCFYCCLLLVKAATKVIFIVVFNGEGGHQDCSYHCHHPPSQVQDYFTLAKLLALVIIIITGIIQLCKGLVIILIIIITIYHPGHHNDKTSGNVENFNWVDTETDVFKIALSFYSGLFAYNG